MMDDYHGSHDQNSKCQACDMGYAHDRDHECVLYNTSNFCGGCIGGEAGRIAALQSLGFLDTPRERVFDAITDMMKTVFNTPGSHLVLLDPNRCWFKSWTGCWCQFENDDGKGPVVQCVREDGWCNYILVPTTAEVLIIEDAQNDARVSLNAFVVGPPYFRFYAGAPLVGSRGERYGTLCVLDFVPRTFSAEQYSILVNFAALAVEELERNKPPNDNSCEEQTVNNVWNNRHLDLSLGASQDGILMLDMRDSKWPILYGNPAFEASSGLALDALVGGNFWDFFQRKSKTETEIGLIIGIGDTFDMEVWCESTETYHTLRFLPATSDRLAPSKATGLPANAPFKISKPGDKLDFEPRQGKSGEIFDHAKCFWFAVVCAKAIAKHNTCEKNSSVYFSEGETTAGSNGSGGGTTIDSCPETDVSSLGFNTHYCEYHLPAELDVPGLGPLLGTGSFGKVFRATNFDELPVAVKVMDCRQRKDNAIESQVREVQLSRCLSHPHVVKILGYATSADIAGTRQIDILWMVQELCDLGTLTRCVERGFLRLERKLTSRPDMTVVISTLHDVATAMEYVHSCGIIHADLTGRNVLLSSSGCRPCGFIAKVADFGLARYTYGRALPTSTLGTITHMPPELLALEDPVLVPEADIWAFGVIAWEAYHGKCCYPGACAPQIAVAVFQGKQLKWEQDAPDNFVSLMKRCLAYETSERPQFSTVSDELQSLIE